MKYLFLLVLLVGWVIAGWAQVARQVLHPTITVSDLDRVLPFYTQTLPFELVGTRTIAPEPLARLFALSEPGTTARIATLRLGAETLELLDFVGTETGQPIPPDSRSHDGWFQHVAIVVSDMDRAYGQLRQRKVEHVSSAPQTLPAYIPAAAGVRAFYFRDPDGHVLELISFPSGKGHPKWKQTDGRLFLGIDHTAIGSADTDTSLAFYRDLLGLTIGGSSENYGPEQEHLNIVFGAHLLITGLNASAGPSRPGPSRPGPSRPGPSRPGPGIELLDYLAPPGGRPYPANTRPNDLWYWHTVVAVNRLDELLAKLRTRNYRLVSPGVVPLDGWGLPARRGLLVRDPDGHALLLCE